MAKKPLHSEALARLEAKKERSRGAKTLYFDLDLFEKFSDWCSAQSPKQSPSRVLEELMRMTLEGAEREK